MSKLEARENKRRAIVESMVEERDQTGPVHDKRGRPKEEGRELKKRISLSVLPSLYGDIQKIAYVQRKSVSELIEELMQAYRGDHLSQLDEYRKIKNTPF